MKTKSFTFAAILILATFAQASLPATPWVANDFFSRAGALSFVVHADNDDYASGEVIVELKKQDAQRVTRRHNLTILEDLEDNLWLVGIPDSRSVPQVVAELNADKDVESAEPNYVLKVPEVSQRSFVFVDQRSFVFVDGQSPSDYFAQYAMQRIRAIEAQVIADGSGVTVAVVDTGVDAAHPALYNLASGRDYVDNDSNPADEGGGLAYGHGTMVAGIIALVAPKAEIMPVRAFDANGRAKASNVGKAIRYAARQGAGVINMSFGLATESAPIRSAIAFASRRAVVLIAAAGNDNSSMPPYPASDATVLAVGATDSADNKAAFSNYGSYIGVAAPGVSIYSTYPGGRFGWGDGTSYAAPFVSGEAALVLSRRGGDAVQTIKNTAAPCCSGMLGGGRIDMLAAVSP